MAVDISMGSVIEHSSVHEVDEALLSLHNVCLFVCHNYYIAFWYYIVQYSIVYFHGILCYIMVLYGLVWYTILSYKYRTEWYSIVLYGECFLYI